MPHAENQKSATANNRVETNRCQASRLRSWPVIGDSFPVCHGTLTAAVAHPERSAASSVMRVFEHTELRGSRVVGESDAAAWPHASQLAQIRAWLGESAHCVGEVRACRRVRSHHGSRQFQSGLAMSARRRLRTWIIPSPMHPPNHQVETNRCQASWLRSWQVIGDVFCVCRRALWQRSLTRTVRRLRVSCAFSGIRSFAVRESPASSERTGGRAARGWRRFDHALASRRVVLAKPERAFEFVRTTARASSKAAWRCRHVGDFGHGLFCVRCIRRTIRSRRTAAKRLGYGVGR